MHRRRVKVSPWLRRAHVCHSVGTLVTSTLALWLVHFCPRSFDDRVELDLGCVLEGDEMAEVFDFPLWQQDLGVQYLNCYCVTVSGF